MDNVESVAKAIVIYVGLKYKVVRNPRCGSAIMNSNEDPTRSHYSRPSQGEG